MQTVRSRDKISRYLATDAHTLDRFEREGRKLGEKELPVSESEDLSKFENDEINSASILWNKFQSELHDLKRQAENEIKSLSHRISVTIPSNERDANEACDAEISKIEAELGPSSANYSDNQTQLDQVRSDLKSVKATLNNRELQTNFEGVYFPFMFVLAFAEVWVNSRSFELFFESNSLVSLLLASAVGAMLVFFAHITGISIKRALPEAAKSGRLKTTFSMLFLNSLVAIFILYLGKMRQAWVALENDPDVLVFEELDDGSGDALLGLENVVSETGPTGLEALISVELGNEGLFLLLFNVVVYVAGTVAALLRHDSHPDFEILTKREKRFRENQLSIDKRYQTNLAAAEKRKADKLGEIRREATTHDTELDRLESSVEAIVYEMSQMKKAMTKALQDRIKAFRRGNSEARKTKKPSYFKSNPSLE